MSFAFIVFHYPKPQYRDDMLRSMRAMAEIMSSVPGFWTRGSVPKRTATASPASPCGSPRRHVRGLSRRRRRRAESSRTTMSGKRDRAKRSFERL